MMTTQTERDPVEMTVAERVIAQRAMLSQCAQTTRRACAEMIALIDDGRFDGGCAEEQFRWLYTLKNRRENILGVLMQLDGQREDRAGMSVRAEADRRWKTVGTP